MEVKLQFIKNNKKKLNKGKYEHTKRSNCDFEYYSKILNIPIEELFELYDYLSYYENNFIISNKFNKYKNNLDEHTFANPLSPQGMIIICFIVNLFLLLWYLRKNVATK